MRIIAGTILLILCLQLDLEAQRKGFAPLKGIVLDSATSKPLEAATVSVYTLVDSSLLAYAITNVRGEFHIQNIPKTQTLRAVISYSGLRSYSVDFIIPQESKELIIETIGLSKDIQSLESVTVSRMRPPVLVKKDTLEFNVSAIKAPVNGVVEDVLRQLPGVEIDIEGNILVGGKRISKITIDGKDFFGSDVKLTTKNLPHNIIDKIQLVDNKSREERFNNSRSSNTQEKALNLVLKKEKTGGAFGRLSVSGGNAGRYEAAGNVNYFNEHQQLSLIGYGNNTNNASAGASSQSVGAVGAGSLTTTVGVGANYNGKIGRRLQMNASYFHDNDRPYTDVGTFRQNILPDTNYLFKSLSRTHQARPQHRLMATVEYKPDSLTEITVTAGGVVGKTTNTLHIEGQSTTLSGELLQSTTSYQHSENAFSNQSLQMFAGRRFRKKGRIWTVTAVLNRGTGRGLDYNQSVARLRNFGAGLDSQKIDLQTRVANNDEQFNLTTNWMEPLAKNFSLRMGYTYSTKTGTSDRLAYSYDDFTGEYTVVDSSQTNAFSNRTNIHTPSGFLEYYGGKMSVYAGASLQKLTLFTSTRDQKQRQQFDNVFPSANFTYNYSKTGHLSLSYSGSSQQPTLEQLQPIPSLTNALFIRHGNPALKPSFAHNGTFNIQQNRGTTFWNVSASGGTVVNQVVEETWLDSVQHTMPINSNGNFHLNLNLNYSKNWKRGATSFRMSLSAGTFQFRNVSYSNKVKNVTSSTGITHRAGLTVSFGDFLTLQPNLSVSFQNTRYSISNALPARNTNINFSMMSQWQITKRVVLESFLLTRTNTIAAPGIPKVVHTLNTGINYFLTKDRRLYARLTVLDILNQNKNVTRAIGPGYIEDRETIALRRYFLGGLSWNLKRF